MAWRKVLTVGLVVSAAVVGCTVNTTNNNGGNLNGDGAVLPDSGSGAKGGTASGGGGSSNGGGGAAHGGGGAANGGGGTANGGAGTDGGNDAGNVCAPAAGDKDCATCLKTKCCQEFSDCSKDSACNGPSGDGEWSKFQACLIGTAADAGTIDSTALSDCASSAAADGVLIDSVTNALVECIHGSGDAGASAKQVCSDQCFGSSLP